jgi:hypothetical protein
MLAATARYCPVLHTPTERRFRPRLEATRGSTVLTIATPEALKARTSTSCWISVLSGSAGRAREPRIPVLRRREPSVNVPRSVDIAESTNKGR